MNFFVIKQIETSLHIPDSFSCEDGFVKKRGMSSPLLQFCCKKDSDLI